ncbi:GCN5-related N-acetyltransferase 6, chloroplastic-like isoform X2 [Gastrolobium bilobum]|uniref:GCN5-related N-acetyltransferase 6, chloroplastic-like isoform X2 n=1 Tax=Gastrolobium bilobum TaxID=150636 RepID=UPI002AB09C50|nr:GCN5-related N-acetyltransferase 6, chloroplastic-like isoform X2 [Gastrolobium bilobum]
MPSISMLSTTIDTPSVCKCPRIAASWTMTMDSNFPPPLNNKKKKEVSVQLSSSTPPVPSRVETLRFCDLHFDRLQPSDQELDQHNRFEFGQFVARQAFLDEEYWTAAWLRAESQWEDRTYERYVDHYKRNFADEEFNAIKKRCRVQNGESCTCIITVRKEKKNVKRSILKSVVGTLDLNIRYLLQGEKFPGERVKAPPFCSINRTPSSRYGYIANLCVAKSARRQGIASNMLYFAVESAKSIGVARVYVHVDRNNRPAQILYQNLGFEIVEMANSLLLNDQTYLLHLQT